MTFVEITRLGLVKLYEIRDFQIFLQIGWNNFVNPRLYLWSAQFLQTTSWAQQKKGGKFKLFVKKNEAKIFKRTFKAIKSIREVKLFTKNCGQVSRLFRCAWFFWKWKAEWFPLIPVEQFNCPCSLEEILHFCEYLKYLWIRERMVFVKLVAHNEYF